MPQAAGIYYHFYEGSGEGQYPVLVLLHGAGGTHLYWPAEMRRLSGYRVYALDLPGHGRSGGRGMQSIQAYAQSVLDWMDALGLHSAIFIGHSMGSAVALTLGLEQPEHTLGLVLIGSGARLRVAPELIENSSSNTTFQNAVDQVIRYSFSGQTPKRLVELAAQRLAEVRPSVLKGDFQACDRFDLLERLDRIQKPTLIVCGLEDQMTPVRYAQHLANHIPQSELKVIPDAGHMLMLEQPQVLVDAVRPFLDRIQFG